MFVRSRRGQRGGGFFILSLLGCAALGCGRGALPESRRAAPEARGSSEFPPELVEFLPYAANPVFTAGGYGHWDAALRERGWVLREPDGYHMWYTGYDGTESGRRMLGYAASRDGLKWTRHPSGPVYRERWVEDVMVVKQGQTYYLFAEGKDDRTHLLVSKDGVGWEARGTLDLRDTRGGPLSPGPFGTPSVLVEDATWYLFFDRSDEAVWLARSSDLRVWNLVQDEPVLRPGPEDYDRRLIAVDQVIRYGGRYYAYYHGTGSQPLPKLWTTNVAVSDDLVHWRKYPGNPLFPAAENKSSGILVDDGQRFRLYTMHERVDVHFALERP
jgi:hypothetical protein